MCLLVGDVDLLVYESCKSFVLRASSGTLKQRNDSRYEMACFHVVIFCGCND